jgi:hypothetical protein
MLEFSDTDTDSEFEMEHEVVKPDTVTLKDICTLSNASKLFYFHFASDVRILCKVCKRHVFKEYSYEEMNGHEADWVNVGDNLYSRYYDWENKGTSEATLNEPYAKGTTVHKIYDYLIECKKVEDATNQDLSKCCHHLLDNI